MKISVIIAVLNDGLELVRTLQSMYASLQSTEGIQVVIVDDCSAVPIGKSGFENTIVHRNQRRLGVGPSRHIGACLATGDVIFIVDSHCRFTPGWDKELRDAITMFPDTLICGSMIGFDSTTPDWTKGNQYFGGEINFYGPDRQKPNGKKQVCEAVWRRVDPVQCPHEIPACLGACYGMRRELYLRFGGLQYLRSWGEDEVMLSLKFWMLAGGVVLVPMLKIGHKFRTKKERIPYHIDLSHVLYNKIFCIRTLLPESRAETLLRLLSAMNITRTQAMKAITENSGIIEAERQLNIRLCNSRFVDRFDWVLERFGCQFPN